MSYCNSCVWYKFLKFEFEFFYCFDSVIEIENLSVSIKFINDSVFNRLLVVLSDKCFYWKPVLWRSINN